MNYLLAQLEAKEFALKTIQDNPNLFGGAKVVKLKIDLLTFEIIQLNNELMKWH